MADPADAKEYAQPRAEAAGLHWPTYERQIQQESGWRHWSAPGVVKSSPTGSMGLGQLNSRFYPESDWRDPYTNLSKSVAIMASNLARFGSYRKALAAYNWGGGNVGGYTDGAGRVHPAWDGTREWRCPHEAAVAQCRTAQRDHYLDVILGPAWSEPAATPAPPPTGAPGVTYDDYRDPQPAGRFAATPKGVILHGSRSGRAGNPLDAEYKGTAGWEVNNPDDLGWNATIGEGRVALHLDPREWGWNARAASDKYLAVELAQPTAGDVITDGQVAAFADWVKTRVLPVWPKLPLVFPTHAEVEASGETGKRDGKTDVYPVGDSRAVALRGRIMAALGEAVAQTPEYAVGPGILAAMAARGDAPATDELFFKHGDRDAYSEAYGTSGARYVWLPATGRVHRFDPAA